MNRGDSMYNLITWKTMITVRNKYTEAKTGDKYLPSGPGTSKIGFFFSPYCHTHRPWPAEELKKRKTQITSKEKCLWCKFTLRVTWESDICFQLFCRTFDKGPNLMLFSALGFAIWERGLSGLKDSTRELFLISLSKQSEFPGLN